MTEGLSSYEQFESLFSDFNERFADANNFLITQNFTPLI